MIRLAVSAESDHIFSDVIRSESDRWESDKNCIGSDRFVNGKSRFPTKSGIGSDVFRQDPQVGLDHLARQEPDNTLNDLEYLPDDLLSDSKSSIQLEIPAQQTPRYPSRHRKPPDRYTPT